MQLEIGYNHINIRTVSHYKVTTIHVSTRTFWQQSKHYFQDLNLFPSIPPSTNQYELRNQKISTRLFIILLIISLTILLLYTSLVTVTKTVIFKTPTLDQYSYLYTKYPETLTCACTKISINYKKLINVQYSFHQVCMSDFVSDDWINYLALSYTDLGVNYNDFRWTGAYTFQALRAFCELMNRTVSDGLVDFYASTYISASVTPLELFQSQVRASIDQFKLSATNSFLLSLSTIRDSTLSNALLSARQTNYYMYLPGVVNIYVSTLTRGFSNCSCDETPTCTQSSVIYDDLSIQVRFTVPGLYIGCYVIESLLQSTLQCFYNQTCINILQSYCSSPFQINVTALDPSISSRYFVNSTIQQLIDSLMVEEWNPSVRYDSYYDECQPAQCIYIQTARNDIIHIVTTLIGLVGGLTTALKLVVPPLVKFVRKKIKPPRFNDDNIIPRQVGDFLPKLKHFFISFNLFPSIPPSTDQYELRNQKISTRLFIILLIISLTILLLYTSLVTVTKTVIFKTPTLDQYSYLYTKYPETLTCACTNISINYKKLVNVQYSFHQVCMSDFVSDDWIYDLALSFAIILVPFDDFRWTGATAFRALHIFCDFMNKSISDSLDRFYASTYISASVTPPKLFRAKMEASVDQFILSVTNSFLLSLSTIRDTTQSNALFNAQLTNYEMFVPNAVGSVFSKQRVYQNCQCSYSATCGEKSAIYDYPNVIPTYIVPDFYVGCFAIESLLRSTLQCFYNQTCINIIRSTFTSGLPINVTALDPSISSRYFVNSTIQQLVNSLMVEEWNPTVRYDSYYDECQPAQCIYTHTTRNDIIYIVTTLIGLVGGLVTVLKLVVPPLVKFVRKRIKPPRLDNVDVQHRPIVDFLPKLKHFLLSFNLFPSIPPSTNQYELRNQKISTRLFIILLTISLTILLLYTSLVTVTKTVIFKTPTLDQYSYLYTKYPETLTCACTKISINYKKLVNVQYSFHQVCMSDFVSDDWINYLALSYTDLGVNYDDFRWTGAYTFQALRAFCELVNRSISDGLNRFDTSTYISASVTPLELFQSQVRASVDQFMLSTTNSFLLSLSIIRDTTHSNGLLSATQTNYYLNVPDGSIFVYSRPNSYLNCSCASSPTCGKKSAIYDYPSTQVKFTVPGLYVGCYVIESLLQSTLQCFYNQTCINIIRSTFTSGLPINVTALDPSISSRYFVNSTIQQLIDSLMVEEWNPSVRYDSYYDECQPAQCIYTHTTRNDIIYIVTTLIGLVGGSMTVLKLIVPRAVKFFAYCISKRRRVVAQIPSVQT